MNDLIFSVDIRYLFNTDLWMGDVHRTAAGTEGESISSVSAGQVVQGEGDVMHVKHVNMEPLDIWFIMSNN